MNKSESRTPANVYRPCLRSAQLLLLLAGMSACGQHNTPGAAHQQRIRLSVGDIREISLPRPTDTTAVLTGSSDNTEVVDVSAKEGAAASPAPSTAGSHRIFLIKGVTIGTARVVFSEKRTGAGGEGQPRKTYLVQVVSK